MELGERQASRVLSTGDSYGVTQRKSHFESHPEFEASTNCSRYSELLPSRQSPVSWPAVARESPLSGLLLYESQGCGDDRARLRCVINPVKPVISFGIVDYRYRHIQPQSSRCKTVYPVVDER